MVLGEQLSLLLFMMVASKGAAGVSGAGLATARSSPGFAGGGDGRTVGQAIVIVLLRAGTDSPPFRLGQRDRRSSSTVGDRSGSARLQQVGGGSQN